MNRLLALASRTGASATWRCLVIAATFAVFSASEALAIPISAQYTISVNSIDPGLVIQTQEIAPNPYVNDLTLGVPVTFDLFRIWTDETEVDLGEDDQFKVAAVFWTFFTPPGGNVSVGTTFGSSFFGFGDAGQVVWANPTIIDFASGTQIQITLSDETFNAASLGSLFFDLTPGIGNGANVTATMVLTRDPAAVPEPASLALLGIGLAGLGFARKKKAH